MDFPFTSGICSVVKAQSHRQLLDIIIANGCHFRPCSWRLDASSEGRELARNVETLKTLESEEEILTMAIVSEAAGHTSLSVS